MNNDSTDLLLVAGEYLITSPNKRPLEDSCVVISDGTVVEYGKTRQMKAKYQKARVMERSSGLIAPGFINCHTHAPMVLFRGICDDIPLKQWLEEYIFPAEAKLNKTFIRLATMLACAEMIRGGTTTFVDMYFFEREMANVVDEVGMRAYLGEGIFDFPSPAFENADKVLEETVGLIEEYKDNDRINFTVDPHTPYTCSSNILEKAASFAKEHSLPLVIHLAETKWEFDETISSHSTTPVKYLDELGLLGPNLVAVHCVWLEDDDIELLAQKGVSVVHCPESNLKLGSGISPVAKLLEAGINVALGTDGAASNNNLDMLGEMDFAAKLPKGVALDPAVVSAEKVLDMATAAGGRAMGNKAIGMLEPGCKADLIVIDLDRPHLRPCYNPVSQLVYAASNRDVTDVLVDGRFLMTNSELVTIDEPGLIEAIKSFQNQPFWKE
ncbi:MAG: amidohydrolase [Thermodesulfobacteria bacterium]|nr:amidohydrolase [Thermodesulfobacteriota bacterium]